jgi:putative FmdB family regulatory protein
MPLYEYQCDACGNRFERIQKFSDPPVEICPVCGGVVRKLFSSPAIQFKGSGWYITDYAKKAPADTAKSSAQPSSNSSADASSPSTAPGSTTPGSSGGSSESGSSSGS